jgi:hypothetical protein
LVEEHGSEPDTLTRCSKSALIGHIQFILQASPAGPF